MCRAAAACYRICRNLAWSQVNETIAQLRGQGTLLLAGRETFIGLRRLKTAPTKLSDDDPVDGFTLQPPPADEAKRWLKVQRWRKIELKNISDLLDAGSALAGGAEAARQTRFSSQEEAGCGWVRRAGPINLSTLGSQIACSPTIQPTKRLRGSTRPWPTPPGDCCVGGVIINRPPKDGRMAFVRSPDGISIEPIQRGDALPPQEPWVSMPNTGAW